MKPSDVPSLTEAQEMMEQARACIAALAVEVRADRDAQHRQLADARQEIEKQRRLGALGRNWQVLQQRIDLRHTTESDVLTGVDTSVEARAVRADLQRNLQDLDRQRTEILTDSDEQPDGLDHLRHTTARVQQLLDQLGVRREGPRR